MGGADVYRFGPFELDPARVRLYRDGERVPLSRPQADILNALVSAPGTIIPRDALIEVGWPGLAIAPNTVDQAISRLRKSLGRDGNGAQYIETVPGRGCRLDASVTRVERHDAHAALDSRLAPFRAFVQGRAGLDTLDRDAILEARGAFEEVLRAAPGYVPAHVGLAHACSLLFESTRADADPDRESLMRAIRHARTGCELEPSWAEAWSTLAFTLYQHGTTVEAAAAACMAIDLDDEDWRHALRLAYVVWGEERLRAARRVLAFCPGFALAYWLMTTVFIARQAVDAAFETVAKGCAAQDAQSQRNGRFPAVGLHLLHGLLLGAAGKVEEAIGELTRELACVAERRQIYARECAANSWYALGALQLRMGRHRDADAAFREALKAVPGHLSAAAALDVDASSPSPARRDPNTIDAAIAQAIRLARGGRHPDAARVCRDALELAPPGYAGWIVPVEPLLNPTAHPDVWAHTLGLVRVRAT